MAHQPKHTPVLLHEAVDGLDIRPDSIVVDCTLGGGGHSAELLNRLDLRGHLIAIDADQLAVSCAAVCANRENCQCVVGNFRDVATIITEAGFPQVDAILADLGWRTDQFISTEDSNGKGFSFTADEPLLMTYGNPEEYPFTAYDVVNSWESSSLIDILRGYSEERYARRIAAAIVEARAASDIKTAKQLADIITSAVPGRYKTGRIHPATRTFQAIRMAVNDELGALTQLIVDGFPRLRAGGRLAIITFHSLEDRVVKRQFKQLKETHNAIIITKKPITPTDEEIADNPRSRSAKLRIIEAV